MEEKIMAVVPAAGIGKRLGAQTNKPFERINNKPLILWALETLEGMTEIREIIPVLKEADMRYAADLFERHNISKVKKIATGGKKRQDSVYKGLQLIDDRTCLVMIHDAVRPLIEERIVKEALRELQNCDGIVTGVPVKDTIKKTDGNVVTETLKRNTLWAIQTPQIFTYASLYRAYESAMADAYYATDDAALVEHYGGTVKVIKGSYTNIKITTPEDISIAEILLNKRAEKR